MHETDTLNIPTMSFIEPEWENYHISLKSHKISQITSSITSYPINNAECLLADYHCRIVNETTVVGGQESPFQE